MFHYEIHRLEDPAKVQEIIDLSLEKNGALASGNGKESFLPMEDFEVYGEMRLFMERRCDSGRK